MQTKSLEEAIEQTKLESKLKDLEQREKQLKIEEIYKSIQNLEWKEDIVAEFLEKLEIDLASLCSNSFNLKKPDASV